MALESCRTSVFTFQSSVHSSHVLRCLDEQRQKDLLCDVTVVVENRSFRAHRSVLASCSDYFSARMSSQTGQGLVVNLPDDVSAEGFEPLLQFAYTSKLLFTKENVLEIRNCASALGFKNLDSACFDFLLPKFFNSSKSSQMGFQRKRCCRDLWKAKADPSFNENDADNAPGDSPPPPNSRAAPENTENEPNCSSNLDKNAASPCHSETKAEARAKSYYFCPKYKFLQACGKAQARVDAEAENAESICSLTRLPCSGSVPGSTSTESCPTATQSSIEAPRNLCSAQICPMIASCALGRSAPISPPSKDDIEGSSIDRSSETDCPRSSRRSSVEMEVANQLSTWPTVCSLQPLLPAPVPCPGAVMKSPELHCPFLRDVGAASDRPRGCEVSPVSAECRYTSSVNSDEDSDSSDSDGDSESGLREQASKMQLPLSVERITSMSRNDFQNFLRTYQLTREQLDYVHDVRRRCKNRIAARRCRKRKLDCIYSLEREINRLRSEKETLTAEKRQLDQMRLKTYQSYSVLYDRLCAEANLGPEQLQVLAKYTSLVECPFSAHMSTKAHMYQCCTEPELQPLAPGSGIDSEPPHRENGQLASISPDQMNGLDTDES
ncbi:transcription regulator protein BACH1b [Trichomycterus rosablanca]|uniref:transcription regulator protein BACH1b n=1 Tax=Trichomycterus rosablanca TaxID=2290929 RepID=UPI002F35883A